MRLGWILASVVLLALLGGARKAADGVTPSAVSIAGRPPHLCPLVDLVFEVVGPCHAAPDHLVLVEEVDDLVGVPPVCAEALVLDHHHVDFVVLVVG
jgi:hypothetical protein